MTDSDELDGAETADGDDQAAGDPPASDPALDAETFADVVQDIGRPVVTASHVAQALDWTQNEASAALDDLADERAVDRLDVSADPVVWYPTDWSQLVDRQRVILFPGRREIVVDHPTQFTRAQLSQFAHLVDTTHRGGYLYELRREDIWGAPYDDFDGLLGTVRDVLPERSPELEEWIEDQWKRAHRFTLRTHEDGYVVLEAATDSLMGNVAREKLDEGQLRAAISDTESWVAEESVAAVKRTLYEAGYPVQDERDLDTGDDLDLDLNLDLRDYQHEWVSQFMETKSGVLVGPPGAGKTVAALGILARVGGESLVLVPSRELASQWREEILARTTLTAGQVGEYHGGTKDIAPVTIATYQTAGMDRHRQLFDSREWGLVVYDECLAGETVVETPDGRTTLEELDHTHDFDAGWNRDIDVTVRSYDPESASQEWVSASGVYKAESPVRKIETNVGHTLRATPGHTHLVFDPDTGTLEEQTDVDVGDFLVRPSPDPSVAETDQSIETQTESETEAELLGWFLGDGHLNGYGDAKFSFGHRKEAQTSIITSLCDRLGIEYSVFDNNREDRTVWIPNFAEHVESTLPRGDKTNSVSTPRECYTWSEERIGALLRGVFDAEGSVDTKSRIQFNSVSESLATDVALLLQKLGIVTRRVEIERPDKNHNDVHRLSVPSFYAGRFEGLIGFRLDHKSRRIETGASPATGLPVGELLSDIKTSVRLSNSDLAEMMGISKQTVGDVIRGRYKLGQRRLEALADSLAGLAESTEADYERVRERHSISYREIGSAIGLSSSGANRRVARTDQEAIEVIEEIGRECREAASEHATRLSIATGLLIVEVTNVERQESETVYDLETESHTFLADGFLTHNCHHIPASVYRRSANLQTKHRLGLSSTPVRESDDEEEIYTLIGPPIGTDWDALFEAGFVAEPEVEIRYVPWTSEDARNQYVSSDGHERRQLAAINPGKAEEVRHILSRHADKKALVFCDYLDQGRELSATLDVPFVNGEMPHSRRERLLDEFRRGDRDTLLVSRVGDEGIDLPDAELAVVASGLGGSRRQGAQRTGRTMRPEGRSLVYVLATRGSREEDFAQRRMRHLSSKGVRVSEAEAEAVTDDASGAADGEDSSS